MEQIITLISAAHVLTASLSLIIGAIVIVLNKGSLLHKKLGVFYFYAMIINNVTSLFIYRLGIFFFPHWLAIITLGIIIPGFLITKFKTYKHWLKIHIICFILSYYMLIGGAINEAFLRIEELKPIMGTPSFGIIHFSAQIIFVIIITYFLIKHRIKNQKVIN